MVSKNDQRRPAIDLLRGVSLMMVVAGHLSLAVIDKSGGDIRGDNLLALFPRWSWVTMIAPMPLFFLAGGYSNATSVFREACARLATFAALAATVVSAWAVPVVIAELSTGSSGVIGDGARLATQPLWFFAAYAPLAASTPWLWRSSNRVLATIIVGCALVVALCDMVRFTEVGPGWIGWIGFLPAYGSFWVAGMWWRRMSSHPRFRERRWGLFVAVICGVLATFLTAKCGYSWALIDAVPGRRSNTTPPTAFTVTAGFLQIGLVATFATVLDSIASAKERFFRQLRNVAVGVYIWHLSALTVVAAVFAAGVPLAVRFTTWWWLTRPLWYLVIGVVTFGLVRITERLVTRLGRGTPDGADAGDGIPARVAGVLVFATAAAHIGLKGPRSSAPAVILVLALATSWWLLTRTQRTDRVESALDPQVRDDL